LVSKLGVKDHGNQEADRNVVFSVNIPVTERVLILYNEATSSVQTHALDLEKLNHWNTNIRKLEGSLNPDDVQSFKTLIDLQSLLLISMMDLAMTSRSLFITRTTPEKAFYVKHSYLLIHEFIVIFDRDRGLKLRKLVTEKFTIMSDDCKNVVKSLSKFKKVWKYEGEMKRIRDKVSAHIEGDFELWYSIINTFDPEQCAQMIISFLSVLNEFLVLCKDIQEQVKQKILGDKNTITSNWTIWKKWFKRSMSAKVMEPN